MHPSNTSCTNYVAVVAFVGEVSATETRRQWLPSKQVPFHVRLGVASDFSNIVDAVINHLPDVRLDTIVNWHTKAGGLQQKKNRIKRWVLLHRKCPVICSSVLATAAKCTKSHWQTVSHTSFAVIHQRQLMDSLWYWRLPFTQNSRFTTWKDIVQPFLWRQAESVLIVVPETGGVGWSFLHGSANTNSVTFLGYKKI